MTKLAPYAKALAAAASAFAGAVATAQTDGVITSAEWVTVAATTLGALVVVFSIKNKPAA